MAWHTERVCPTLTARTHAYWTYERTQTKRPEAISLQYIKSYSRFSGCTEIPNIKLKPDCTLLLWDNLHKPLRYYQITPNLSHTIFILLKKKKKLQPWHDLSETKHLYILIKVFIRLFFVQYMLSCQKEFFHTWVM